jgi:transposase
MIEAARAAARSKGTYSSAQYARIARRRGPNKAAVALSNSMLNVVWHLLTNGELYQDLGADYFEKHNDPEAQVKRLAERIEALGFEVTVAERVA